MKTNLILAAVALLSAATLYAQTEAAPSGTLDPDTGFVTDENGYRYQYTEGRTLELCAGGRYSGTVEVPRAVVVGGDKVEVAGIAADAFDRNNPHLTLLVLQDSPAHVYAADHGIRFQIIPE